MTTNVLLLPRLAPTTSFTISTNEDWKDSIFFGAIGSPNAPINMVGQTANASNVITVANTTGLVPGMPISQIAGIPAGAFIGTLTAATTLTMVDASDADLDATLDNVAANLTFQPVPLDLTGIKFVANLKPTAFSNESILTVQTSDGSFNNGGSIGVLSFDMAYTEIANIFPGSYVMDIIAEADNATINLLPAGPATVNVIEGVTDPTT